MIKLNTTILCFCTLLISASCFAQENEKKAFVSIGSDVAFPTQNFQNHLSRVLVEALKVQFHLIVNLILL